MSEINNRLRFIKQLKGRSLFNTWRILLIRSLLILRHLGDIYHMLVELEEDPPRLAQPLHFSEVEHCLLTRIDPKHILETFHLLFLFLVLLLIVLLLYLLALLLLVLFIVLLILVLFIVLLILVLFIVLLTS